MQFIAATATLHSIDAIEVFLRHMERIGASGVLVIDLGSEDATLDILTSQRWAGFVHLLPSISMANNDSETWLLAAAKVRFNGLWCLFTDPDELVSPSICNLAPDRDISCYQIPRRNVTARRELLDSSGSVNWRDLRLEIVKPVERTAADPMDRLVPPWVHTRVFDKVLVRVEDTLEIGEGDHSARTRAGRTVAAQDVTIRHYPLRSYAAFETKVRTIETFLPLNPQHGPDWAWHWRRWVRIMQAGQLHEEFLAQFPDTLDAAWMIGSGVIREIEPPEVEDQAFVFEHDSRAISIATTPAARSVEIHVPVSLNEHFSHMMYFLTKSIDRFARLGSNYKIVFTVSLDSTIDPDSNLLLWARELPVEFRYCADLVWRDCKFRADTWGRALHVYTAPLLQQIAYDFESDVVIFMDTDTLVCGSLAEIVDRAARMEKIFGWPTWQPPSIDLMAAIRDRGCTQTEFELTYSGYGWSFMEPKECPPYFNFGFLVMNQKVARRLGQNLPVMLDFVFNNYYDVLECQVALCLAIIDGDLQYEALPEKYNYGNGDWSFPIHPQLGLCLYEQSMANFRNIRVLHYCAPSTQFKKSRDLATWDNVKAFCSNETVTDSNLFLRDMFRKFIDERFATSKSPDLASRSEEQAAPASNSGKFVTASESLMPLSFEDLACLSVITEFANSAEVTEVSPGYDNTSVQFIRMKDVLYIPELGLQVVGGRIVPQESIQSPAALRLDTQSDFQGRAAKYREPFQFLYSCEDVCILSNLHSGNFHHWITEELIKVTILERHGFEGSYVVPNLPNFALEFLRMLGIPRARVIDIVLKPTVFKSVVFTTSIHGDNAVEFASVFLALRKNILDNVWEEEPPASSRLWLDRKLGINNPGRELINVEQVHPILRRHGVDIIDMAGLPIRTQIAASHNAELIIGPHGAQFVHALFMKRNSDVIECFSPEFINTGILGICSIMGHKYQMMVHNNAYGAYPYGESLHLNCAHLEVVLRASCAEQQTRRSPHLS